MKKFLLFSFLFSTAISQAQVVLESHMPAYGTTYSLNSIAAGAITTSPATGANVVWDYSGVTPNAIINYKVVDPATLPSNIKDTCPDANFAVQQQGAPNASLAGYDFYTDKGTHLRHSGTKNSGSGACQRLTDTILMFGQAYNTTQFYYGFYRTYAGYGTLKVNNKTYNDVVLIKSVSPGNTSDTAFQFHRMTPAYALLLSFNNGPNGIKNTIYFGWDPNEGGSGNSITEYAANGGISVYPNPAKGLVKVQTDNETNLVELYNLNGQLIKSERSQGETTHELSLEGIPAGIYTLQFGSRHQKLIVE